jgi:cellulose synthase (UDP-forming)
MRNIPRKYLYVDHDPLLPKVIGVWGIFAAIMAAIGFIRFLSLEQTYLIIWFIPIFFLITNRLTRYLIYLCAPLFNIKKHERFVSKFWTKNKEPNVDIFVTYAGEDIQLIRNTLAGVKNIDYKKLTVYVLDDQGSKELKEICAEYKYKYLSRRNKGEYKKSGNLQYGYDHSEGEFVLVLDVDFVPDPSILRETIPYIASDSSIGILQTPQYFETTSKIHRRSPIEYGGGNVVEDFYRFDMPGRDAVGGAMCVGTSAIYRREAIVKGGGTPKVWGTEDVRQGLKIMKVGYKVRYLPLILSQGISPDSIEGYFKQHMRWCTGSIETVFGKYFREAQMSWQGRIVYFVNLSFYLSNALAGILAFHIFVLLFFHFDELQWLNVLWFIPQLVLTFVMPYFYRISKPRYGTYLAASTQMFTYLYTIPHLVVRHLRRKEAEWIAANLKVSKISPTFISMTLISTLIYSLYLFVFAVIRFISPRDFLDISHTGLLVGWFVYSTFVWGMFITSILRESSSKLLHNFKSELVTHFYVYRFLVPAFLVLGFAILSVIVSFTVSFIESNYNLVPHNPDSDVLKFQQDLKQKYYPAK